MENIVWRCDVVNNQTDSDTSCSNNSPFEAQSVEMGIVFTEWVIVTAFVAVLVVAVVVVLVDVNTNVLAGVLTVLEFAISESLKEFSCWAAFDCWPLTLLDCACVLQTWMPSCQVWSSLAFPAPPQFPNQEPPRPQQLLLPDFLMETHVGHTELAVVAVVVVAAVSVGV